jgi:nitrogen fixation protein NifZ
MMEPREPKFQWGQRVKAALDLFNDGTYPGRPADELLVPAADCGEIVQIGTQTDSGLPIYLVEFLGRKVVGCLEEEILPVEAG